jgi:hypothetical protein
MLSYLWGSHGTRIYKEGARRLSTRMAWPPRSPAVSRCAGWRRGAVYRRTERWSWWSKRGGGSGSRRGSVRGICSLPALRSLLEGGGTERREARRLWIHCSFADSEYARASAAHSRSTMQPGSSGGTAIPYPLGSQRNAAVLHGFRRADHWRHSCAQGFWPWQRGGTAGKRSSARTIRADKQGRCAAPYGLLL